MPSFVQKLKCVIWIHILDIDTKKIIFYFFYFETSMQCGSLFIWINRNAQRKQYKEIFACANLTDHLKHSTLYKKALNNSNSLFIS